MAEKYYKIIRDTGASMLKQFDYSDYLPKNNEAGKWLPEIKNASLTNDGYYITKYWNMWYEHGARIYEVDYEGKLAEITNGVEHQACCSKIRLLKDVTDQLVPSIFKRELDDNFDEVASNTGVYNTGKFNTGSYNVGNYNTGNRNTGNLNLGDFNTGDSNSGIDNVGDNNKGSGNVGSNNVGHSNTGESNTGSFNSGSYNKGNCNSGSFNVGSFNSGKWNLGSYHAGFFNTQEEPLMMFNKPTNLSRRDIRLPKWLNSRNPKNALKKATKSEIEQALALPNFDYAIFEQITGVSKADIDSRLAELKE